MSDIDPSEIKKWLIGTDVETANGLRTSIRTCIESLEQQLAAARRDVKAHEDVKIAMDKEMANSRAELAAAKAQFDTLYERAHMLEHSLAAANADAERAHEKYSELLLAVGNKFPNESRHETALRYIQAMENIGTAMREYQAEHAQRTTEGEGTDYHKEE